ncbi:MAG: metallophosphoesterase family protein [Streptosporangiaceae bacterium]
MRLLHISDRHIGRLLYGEPRAADHDAVLQEITGLARQSKPDLILHTGDVFDTARPAVQDMQRAISWLQELAATAPVAVVAGNHDSPALFQLFNSLLSGTSPDVGDGTQPRIRFVGKARGGPAGILRYAVSTSRGDNVLQVAPLPFVRDGLIVDTMEDPATWLRSYADRVQLMEAALGRELADGFDPSRDVNIFAAHLYVGGATFDRSEKPIHISDVYATTVTAIPPVSYAAFGHIHKPQPLPGGTVTGRYAGSPIPLDFGERDEVKTVVLVDVEPSRPAVVGPVNLTAGRPLREFTGTLEQLSGVATGWGNALSKLIIHTETPTPDLSDRVARLLPAAVLCDVTEICAASQLAPVEETVTSTAAEPQLPELFREFLTAGVTAGADAQAVAAEFTDLLQALDEESRPLHKGERQIEELLALARQADTIAAGNFQADTRPTGPRLPAAPASAGTAGPPGPGEGTGA